MAAALAVVLAGCAGIEWVSGDVSESDTAVMAPADPNKLRLLGALPPSEAERGVYVVDLQTADELSPGSRLAPIVRPYVERGDADLLVETAAPPVTLLGGVSEDLSIPSEAVRVDDVVVFAEPTVAEQVARRLRESAPPDESLVGLAAADVPVAWAGPTPAPGGVGRTMVSASAEQVRFVVDLGDADVAAALSHTVEQLANGGPPGSPGKPWSTIFGQPKVVAGDGTLTITAVPLDLPGLFLRALLDQRQASFLPSG